MESLEESHPPPICEKTGSLKLILVFEPRHLEAFRPIKPGSKWGITGCINGRSIGSRLRTGAFQITLDILSLITRVDEFKGVWRALGTLASDRLSVLRWVATIENIGPSTRIEGSTRIWYKTECAGRGEHDARPAR